MQMAQAAGLRGRLLLTIGMLLLIRLGIYIPVPGIDRAAFQAGLQGSGLGNIIGVLDVLAGGGISALGIFALGILPYINASIIIQLMTTALPSLEDLQKNEGEAGRRKISQITRYVALVWAIFQSFGIALFVNNYALTPGPTFIAQTVLALTTGSMFVMWVGELITERGIGNGASLLIFIGIVSTLPRSLGQTVELAQSGDRGVVGGVIILMLVFLVMIVGIVFVQEGTRRIPILSARRQVGRKLYLEKSSYLPLRLNQGGVMPIIFASMVLFLPASVAQFFRVLRRFTGFMQTVLFPLFSAWIASQVSFCLQRLAVVRVKLAKRPRYTQANRVCLSGQASTSNVYQNVILSFQTQRFQRRFRSGQIACIKLKVKIPWLAVNGQLTVARNQPHPSN